jgi:Tol biopolymer transport system component
MASASSSFEPGDPKGRNFDLWSIRDDGTGLEQITFDPSFDGFPMFSPDGRRLASASNRNARVRGETNVFVVDWVEEDAAPAR